MNERAEALRHELILHWIRRGDQRGFEELYALWGRKLLYYIRRLVETADEAEEVSAEVWVQILRSAHRVRDPRALRSWIYQLTRNVLLEHLRRRRRWQMEPLEETDLSGETEPDPAGPIADAAAWQQALETLSLPHREVILLARLEAFDLPQIADLIGVPVGTAKSRLHYARRALTQALGEEGAR